MDFLIAKIVTRWQHLRVYLSVPSARRFYTANYLILYKREREQRVLAPALDLNFLDIKSVLSLISTEHQLPFIITM